MTKRIARITERKSENVNVPTTSRYLGYLGYGYRPSAETFQASNDIAGTYFTDDWGRTWSKRVTVAVWIDGYSLEELIEHLRTSAEDLTSPHIDIDRDEDGYPKVSVIGTRAATEEEVAEVLRYLEFDKASRAKNEETQRERLIKQAKAMGLKPEDLS